MRIANDTYYVHMTNVPTPPAPCLGTQVPRQKCRRLDVILYLELLVSDTDVVQVHNKFF